MTSALLFCRHRVLSSAVTWRISFDNILCVMLSSDAFYGECDVAWWYVLSVMWFASINVMVSDYWSGITHMTFILGCLLLAASGACSIGDWCPVVWMGVVKLVFKSLLLVQFFFDSYKTWHMICVSIHKLEVKVIWQKAPHGGANSPVRVTPGGRKLYHWIPGVEFPISVP